ncbi:MAG: formyltetrahydrofolate deformylase [Rhodospirillaceae bacterium]|nr:formyltetrahydrofolate deformylase [Rhodospirillaceae bacterium]RPF96538.1 MAG: formyltetrahydrofolate deformylase [Rhodospirillaceae bacterium TMED63]RZO35759.1 MAG: formyltetrahydrofolate deformylase [Rhodospirillaceae bacterium]
MTISYVLTTACPDKQGIVAAISGFLADSGCSVDDAAFFSDPESERFYGRSVFRIDRNDVNAEMVGSWFGQVAHKFDIEWDIFDTSVPKKVMIMVSKFDHCLNDLLYRYRIGALPMEVTAIVSNHPDAQPLADAAGIPYHHIPVSKDTKLEAEARLYALIERTGTDLVVLARYMQVLSDDLCRKLDGQVINIHHSFLPGFKGAKPYHQAFARGVKLIGATAHFVTADLDEGPIIEQAVERIDHTTMPDQMVAIGRDLESVALARAVGYVLERRVLMNGAKTVVFR